MGKVFQSGGGRKVSSKGRIRLVLLNDNTHHKKTILPVYSLPSTNKIEVDVGDGVGDCSVM